jgi:NAD(P)-dependent dehydrogenase (short-subunit alcohol dehydrogenase family)
MATQTAPSLTGPPVVVLTGASSGIGRATAHELARGGARLVLAARDSRSLEDVAQECERLGGTAAVVPTDVTIDASVRALADQAVQRFGHFDVWINNVGVGAVGRFDSTPLEAHRRVIESNLVGHINGSHVALAHFRQRHRGTLINMVSIGGWLAAPYAAAYTASKFALRGLGQSLRAELIDEPDIHVCDVYPAFVDTPGITQHGANYTGHRLRPFPPLLKPETVANRIVSLLSHPRPTLPVGAVAYFARYTQNAAPELRTRRSKRLIDRAIDRAPAVAREDGNLFEISRTHAVSGGNRRPLTAALMGIGAAGLIGLALYSLSGRQPRRSH